MLKTIIKERENLETISLSRNLDDNQQVFKEAIADIKYKFNKKIDELGVNRNSINFKLGDEIHQINIISLISAEIKYF